jgi:sigma-E factor negative regulatory protein RseA
MVMDKISTLMDGELDEHQARGQVLRLKQDEELTRDWHTFHLIGDAMRGERALSPDFSRHLAARLAAEPTVLAPRRSTTKRAVAYALSAAASLAAVALVGGIAFFNNPLAPQSEIARAPVTPAPAAVPSPQIASVPSDGKMNDYLIAHQEFSSSTAIQGLAPYIRSVSSTPQSQGR